MRVRRISSATTLNDIDLHETLIICNSVTDNITLSVPASGTGKENTHCVIANIGTTEVHVLGRVIIPRSHAHIFHNGSYFDMVLESQDITEPLFRGSIAYGITDTNLSQLALAYMHSQDPHAPANAQLNADITKEEIEAKLVGTVDTHTHNLTKAAIEAKLTGTITTHKHPAVASGHEIRDDGVEIPYKEILNFTGSGVCVTDGYLQNVVHVPRYEPLMDGNLENPGFVFANGDIIMVEV